MSESAARMKKAIDRAATEFEIRLSVLEIQRGEAAKAALDALAERDAALAVIEQVRGDMILMQMTADPNDSGAYVLGREAEKALATSPPDALDALKADVWDDGYTVGNRHNGRRDNNPYRNPRTPGEETT